MSGTTAKMNRERSVAPRASTVAAIAAAIAVVGDVMMLYVANVARPDLGLRPVPVAVLWVGGLLGVFAIPVYVFGYRAAAALVSQTFASHARVITFAGSVGSMIGAVIHGGTAKLIHDRLVSGTRVRDPILAVGESPTLVVLWGVATVLVVAASIAFVLAVLRGVPSVPRRLAWANVALIVMVIAIAGSATPALRAFLMPAAPNVAHVVFFAACARALERRGQTPHTVFDSFPPS